MNNEVQTKISVAKPMDSTNERSFRFKIKLKAFWADIVAARYSYFLLAPFFLIFTLFVFVPVVAAVVLSFTNFDMVQAPEFIGFTNYARLFLDDPIFNTAVSNTILFAVITGPLGFIASFIFAWLINELEPRVRSALTFVFYAPALAGGAVFTIWKFIFSGDMYGFINSQLMKIGLIKDPIQWLTDVNYNFEVVVLVIIWLSMGAGFLSFIAGLQGLNSAYFEAGAIDGITNRWQELWYITLPQMVPQLLFGAVMSISASFAVGAQSIELTGMPSTDYSTHTILIHMIDYGTIRFEMGYASAIAVVLFTTMLLCWKVIEALFRSIE